MKLRIGILFGGQSREREVSFAGGRTVYDNLNKSLFEPVPVFIDSFGNFILIDWQYIYKGSIRDFYPPVEAIPPSPNFFQVYAESLGNLSAIQQDELINKIGRRAELSDLKQYIDFAFLCLHGPFGEDGRIQGMLEYHGIPYSGSGILSSAIGINKSVQKELMTAAGFSSPPYLVIHKQDWNSEKNKQELFKTVQQKTGFPCVIKPANQGSSIGVSVLAEPDAEKFIAAVDLALFKRYIKAPEWIPKSREAKISFVKEITDIREGIGLPVYAQSLKEDRKIIYHPEEVLSFFDAKLKAPDGAVTLEAVDGETTVLAEGFIEGKEFSCIVLEGSNGVPIALPPTEIRKSTRFFDYRSKYMPGLSRKVTPIDLPAEQIEKIRKDCGRLYTFLHFNVYARIDGFISKGGQLFLNDPNTTSGMMPSSFFFHQAAEIGLNPSQFLTYIIRTSLACRMNDMGAVSASDLLMKKLDESIEQMKKQGAVRKRIAVILGGYSSERHISVESGRNIYEKLSSSTKYEPVPVFLTGNDQSHQLHVIPINILLKDNADDIREKIFNYHEHPVLKQIINEAGEITRKYSASENLATPYAITYEELAEKADAVFIALHGRPGEDGAIQAHLEKVGLPYNGSGIKTSSLTIDKFETNEYLRKNGFPVAKHAIVSKADWQNNKSQAIKNIVSAFSFPFITKPVDDGCSSAVKKIKNQQELESFGEAIFRNDTELNPSLSAALHLKTKEEFPVKQCFLVEELITKNGASHFLEITGGLLTREDEKGNIIYELFEPSEALSEGDVLSLEEKFLAGEGQNITPARYSRDPEENAKISGKVRAELEKAARTLNIEGYARIDAFVRIFNSDKIEVIFIEVNSLPGMTPATCIFHQCALSNYKPYQFIDQILEYGMKKKSVKQKVK